MTKTPIWVDTGQLALDAYKDSWLIAPEHLFRPDASAQRICV